MTSGPARIPVAGMRRVARSFRPDIQALRALAVASVLLYHLWPNRLTGGFVGVDVFFVISGYLITSHLVRERSTTGRIALGRFWARRATRLLPAALLVLLATAATVVLWVPQSLWRQFLGEITASALYVENWRLLLDSVDYLAAENTASPVRHFWTLSAEEQFYVLLPLLLVAAAWAFRRFSWRTVMLTAIAIATALSFAYSVWLLQSAPGEAYFSTFSRAWEFGVGALLAFAPPLLSSRGGTIVAGAGILAILASVFFYTGTTPFPGEAAALPVLGTAAAIWAGGHSALAPFGRFAPISFLGRVSYAVYLWHWPLIVLVPFVTEIPLTTAHKLSIIVASLLLAWLSTSYIEDTVRSSPRLLRGRRPRTIAAWSAAGMACVLLVSLSGTQFLRASEARVHEVTEDLVEELPECFGASAWDPSSDGCASRPYDGVDIVPALTDIEEDDGDVDECRSQTDVTELNMCSYGPRDADVRIVAIGDSHNNAMLPAYREAAEHLGWRIDVAGHAGCFWTDEELELATDEQTASCEEWRDRVDDYVQRADDVDAYLVASRGGETDAGQDRVDGMVSAWERRADTSVPVLALLDNPSFIETPVTCVSEDPATAAARCAVPQDVALLDDGKARAVERDPNARLVDLTRFFCRDDSCPAVIGGVVVYRDSHHLTGTYAATLGPYLARELETIVG